MSLGSTPVNSPVICYRPNAWNVARLAPPPDMPAEKPSKTIGHLSANLAPVERRNRAAARKRPTMATKETCPHERFSRIAAWKPKNGIERVRARCCACGKEKIKAVSEVPPVYGHAWRGKV